MPLYIVRWPAFNVSLVRARNEEELLDTLDEVADPGACRWAVYKGPVFLDLDLPVKPKWDDDAPPPLSDAEVELEGVEEFQTEGALFKVSIASGDTGWEMKEAIGRWAFPSLMRTIESSASLSPKKSDLVTALRAELLEMIRYHWRSAHVERRGDREAAILQALGLTVAPPWLKRAMANAEASPQPTEADLEESGGGDEPIDDPECPF